MVHLNKNLLDNKNYVLVLLSVITSVGFGLLYSFTTANIVLIILCLIFYLLYNKAFSIEKNDRVDKASSICACFFALSMIPSHLEDFESSGVIGGLKVLICLIAFAILYKAVLIILFDKANSLNIKRKETDNKIKTWKVFVIITLCFLLAWIPFFLYVFPGDLSPDSYQQFMQAFGGYPLSDHHPVVHTLLIQKIVTFGLLISNNDLIFSLALYSFCQALFLAMSFSYLVTTLYVSNVKKWIIIASVLFYAIPAYHGFYSVEMWKDIWFAGFITIFSVSLWRMLRKIKSNSYKIKCPETILFIISSVGICLFRSNGLYAYLLFFVFFVIYALKHRFKSLIMIGFIAIVVALVVKVPVYNAMEVERPDILESIGIPMQQVAAVVVENKEITDEEKKLIENVIDYSVIPTKYNKVLCDPIKFAIRDKEGQKYISEHKSDYFGLWLKLGIKYPGVYIRAYINQTYGFYDTDVQYVVYYPISGKFENPFRVKLFSEKYYNAIDAYSNLYKSIPFIGLLWSIGTAVWLTALLIGLTYIKKNKAFLLVFIPNVGVWLTLLIATPSYAEFRYIYSLFTVLPLYFVCALSDYNLDKIPEISRGKEEK